MFFTLFLKITLISLFLISCKDKSKNLSSIQNSMTDTSVYTQKIQPILTKRCAICHACNDSPCELKLTSWEGLSRGAAKLDVYGTSLEDRPQTRLHIDASGPNEWQEKFGFSSIIYRDKIHHVNQEKSVLSRILTLKERYGTQQFLTDKRKFESKSRECPIINTKDLSNVRFDQEMKKYEQERAWGGMPYGLPQIPVDELKDIKDWMNAGASGPNLEIRNHIHFQNEVKEWEYFLNNKNDPRMALISKYIYEHLFAANIHFDDNGSEFYRLIRSRKNSAGTVVEIPTRRPFDEINIEFEYRFVKIVDEIAVKSHLPYKLDVRRMQRYKELFLNTTWDPIKKEDSKIDKSLHKSNPYYVFADIPEKSRYQFLLDEAHFFVNNFIRGPVCVGQNATNVINEHFWIIFLHPDFDPALESGYQNALTKEVKYLTSGKSASLLQTEYNLLQIKPLTQKWVESIGYGYSNIVSTIKNNLPLPEIVKNQFTNLEEIVEHTKNTNQFNQAYKAVMANKLSNKPIPINALWDGNNKSNNNAILTVFRHFDSVSVEKGALGNIPKTAWLMNYQIFETLYYNLAAGFDIYSDIFTQLATRIFMENSRYAAEDLFLNLFPKQDRLMMRNFWSRDDENQTKAKIKNAQHTFFNYDEIEHTPLEHTNHYDGEKNHELMSAMFALIMKEFGQKTNGGFDLINCKDCNEDLKLRDANPNFTRIENKLKEHLPLKMKSLYYLPEISFIQITENEKPIGWYTMLKHLQHFNVTAIFGEEDRIDKNNTTIEFYRGFMGAYPNVFFRVELSQLKNFFMHLKVDDGIKNHVFKSKYVIGRGHNDFWKLSDDILESSTNPKRGGSKLTGGIFDLSRYENVYN